MYKMYGIPNCDTIKKAKKYLSDKNVEFEFIDFKKVDPKKSDLTKWTKFFGEVPVNKRGTTFRKLKDQFEGADQKEQIKLLIDNPSAIKRPILTDGNNVISIGFKKENWDEVL